MNVFGCRLEVKWSPGRDLNPRSSALWPPEGRYQADALASLSHRGSEPSEDKLTVFKTFDFNLPITRVFLQL